MWKTWDEETTPLVIGGRWEIVKVLELGELHAHRTPDDRQAGKWYVHDCLGNRTINGQRFGIFDSLEECYAAVGEKFPTDPVKIKTSFGSITAPIEYHLTH